MSHINTKAYESRPEFLASENFTAFTEQASTTGDYVETVNGRTIAKAGHPYPANDGTAVGIIMNDADVANGDQVVSVMRIGVVIEERLPVTLDAATKEAITGIMYR